MESDQQPSTFNYVLSFLLVGVAWGFTTPFIRRAATDFNARQQEKQTSQTKISHDGQGGETQPLLGNNQQTTTDSQDQVATGKKRAGTGQKQAVGSSGETLTDDEDINHEEEEEAEEEEVEENSAGSNTEIVSKKDISSSSSWISSKLTSLFHTVFNLLRTPAYLIPLLINLTGSIWFFLLVGKHELSLTVPIANSSAFLFTVLGEWYVERKGIAKETWLGMVLVLGGIALCVHSKNQTGST